MPGTEPGRPTSGGGCRSAGACTIRWSARAATCSGAMTQGSSSWLGPGRELQARRGPANPQRRGSRGSRGGRPAALREPLEALGLVDEHHRDAVGDRVAKAAGRALERRAVLHEVELALALGTGENLE